MDDVEIQVHAVVQRCLKKLKHDSPHEDFDLIIRDFSPAIHIQMRKTQLSELMISLFEEFVLDSPVLKERCYTIMAVRWIMRRACLS